MKETMIRGWCGKHDQEFTPPVDCYWCQREKTMIAECGHPFSAKPTHSTSCNLCFNPHMTTDTGKHFDDGKVGLDQLDADALTGLARVMDFGANKYGRNNWRSGIHYSRILGSLLRHLFALLRSQDIDDESGLPHIDHILCNAMFLSYYMKNKPQFDDRWKEPTNAVSIKGNQV